MLTKNIGLLANVGLVLCVAVMAASAGQEVTSQQMQSTSGGGENLVKAEPVLLFDVSGTTMAGSVHKHLSVYSNGRISLAEYGPGGPSRNLSKMISPGAVDRLRSSLATNNGLTLNDQAEQATDIPLTTVSVFRGATDAVCHSFSFWLAEEGYAGIKQTVDAFIIVHFSDAE
ncbi:MAG: hypothetical protein ACI8QZ_001387 [Chlamydiales bacterium]|jgi:hypothetical protein